MARRAEVAAGVAAAAIAVTTLLVVVLAPLICRGAVVGGRCAGGARMTSLFAEARHVEAAVWVYLGAMFVLTMTGAAGAALDGARGDQRGLALLWGGTSLAFAGCALGVLGVFGSLYLPSVVALLIAAYAAFVRRTRRTEDDQGRAAPDRPGA